MARTRSLLAFLGIFSVIVSGLVFLSSTRTQAGFEWVPANKAAAVDETPVSEPITTPPVTVEPAEAPQILIPDMTPADTGPVIKVIHPHNSDEVPAMEMPEQPAQAPIAAEIAEMKPEPKLKINAGYRNSFSEIAGFGSDMPLAFALSQIVPDGYAYSLGRNVNPAAPVSWSGGKPWPDVVQDMIQPLDLSLSLQDRTILIYDPVMAMREQYAAPAVKVQTPAKPEIQQDAQEQPTPLLSPDTQRQTITNPGEKVSEQPQETMRKIETLTAFQKASSTPVDHTIKGPPTNSYWLQRNWQGHKGASLKETLEHWSEAANVRLYWEAQHDYVLANNIMMDETFENAVTTLLDHTLEGAEKPAMTLLETPGGPNAAQLIIR